jgi:predicted nucleotidyltransferase
MTRELERRWPDLHHKAMLPNDFDRVGALANAVSAIEIALTAAGIPREKREGIMSRIKNSDVLKNSPSLPEWSNIKEAIEARNSAIHDANVPKDVDCLRHINVFHKLWGELRRTFVTHEQAAALASSLLKTNAISKVFLFGSLARNELDPHDIDLLLFDEGEFSYLDNSYNDRALILGESIDTLQNRAALECGWLDFVIIDGRLLGANKDYTLSFSKKNNDPLFLVNVSDRLQMYDQAQNSWVKQRPQVFERLATLRQQLEIEHIVEPQ